MTTKRERVDTGHIVQLYQSGETIKDIAARFGRDYTAIHKRLQSAGISTPRKIHRLPVSEIAASYISGESVKSIASRYYVARHVIIRHLKQATVDLRSRSEAERVKWQSFDADRTRKQLGAAWTTRRGQVVQQSVKETIASTRESRKVGVFNHEDRVFGALTSAFHDLSFTQQFAWKQYNLDIACNELPVAVEISGASPHEFRKIRLRDRLENLLNGGWFVVIVRFRRNQNFRFDLAHVGKELVTSLNLARTDKTVFGKYRMVLGNSQYRPTGHYDLDGLPFVP